VSGALLFAALSAGLALIALAAWRGGAVPIALAALVLALWMAGNAVQASRRRR
jgi:hypothetical protein